MAKMNRIDAKFEELKQNNKKGFVAYIAAGDPTLVRTKEVVLALERAGADVVELGIPFSDPLADGVVNQRAAERALKNDVSLADVINLVADIRRESQIPIVFFTYINPVVRYGIERFVDDAAKAGVDGVLALDFPPEEWGDYKKLMDEKGVSIITLIAPTSSDERIRMISQLGTGFIYYVSRTGVTGARDSIEETVDAQVDRIRSFTDKPVAVGFGISSREHVEQIHKAADAAVVGSAIVKKIEEAGDDDKLADVVEEYVRGLIP
jgi:tryptophan synthase alpha chain